jgi:hypothetical protein
MLVGIGTDCIGSCKSNYHTIMTMTAPIQEEIKIKIPDIIKILHKIFASLSRRTKIFTIMRNISDIASVYIKQLWHVSY